MAEKPEKLRRMKNRYGGVGCFKCGRHIRKNTWMYFYSGLYYHLSCNPLKVR